MKLATFVLVTAMVGACSSGKDEPRGREGAAAKTEEPAPSEQAPPPAVPVAQPDPAPAPAAKKTEKCENMAPLTLDRVCGTSWECEEYSYEINCAATKAKDTLVCACNWDAEDKHTFEMPRADCKSLGLETFNERCELPVALAPFDEE